MSRISFDKLQHIYDLHPEDFGLSGNKNPLQLAKLGDALKSDVADAGTRRIEGKYRGRFANLHFAAESRIIVVTDQDDNVIAAFKASPHRRVISY